MDSYLKSWKTMSHRNFPPANSDEFEMKTSFKVEEQQQQQQKGKVDGSDSGRDPLPIHCIIQTISTVEELQESSCQACEEKSNRDGQSWWECSCKKNEMSGWVIVPESTLMNDLVTTVLVKLGYPTTTSSFAAGSFLIRNWKPLSLETVCPGLKKTVTEILGELTAVVSLRIRVFRPKISTLQKIKDNLLSFLIRTNQSFLRDSGCPFDAKTLSTFCDQSDYPVKQALPDPSDDLHRKFDAWLQHHQENEESEKTKIQNQSGPYLHGNGKEIGQEMNGERLNANSNSQTPDSVRSENVAKNLKESNEEENTGAMNESSSFSVMERPKNFATPKTRVRTSFDPEFELPRLFKWFVDNPHPSRQQIYEYVAELNSLDSRKGRKQLDVNNVVYWFKNARAAQKRTESRKAHGTPTPNNRCSVLKIPLEKSSGCTSDDQRSVSDDEASVTSESGDDYRNENGRCLQVVGKWNSNGQGEAVLEMQIAAHKNEFVRSMAPTKNERTNEDEETSKSEMLSANEDSTDPVSRTSLSDKKEFSVTSEKNSAQKENQVVNVMESNKNEIRKSDINCNDQKQSNGEIKDDLFASKIPVRNNFAHYKENNGMNNNVFMSPFKSGFPVSPNSILGHSFICMSQYINSKSNGMPLVSSEERRKRNRTFIDPVTEVPRLEQWFRLSTHPSHNLIARYTEELNNMPYRRKFPKLEAKNVQFWFKNRRAKNKRLNHLEPNNN